MKRLLWALATAPTTPMCALIVSVWGMSVATVVAMYMGWFWS